MGTPLNLYVVLRKARYEGADYHVAYVGFAEQRASDFADEIRGRNEHEHMGCYALTPPKEWSKIMMIENMTLGELQRLMQLLPSRADDTHWRIGSNYFVRTVTHHLTGKLVKVTPHELVLVDAAWIADDGRFHEAMASGTLNEVEPYPDDAEVIVGRGSLIDATQWVHPLPRDVK